MQYIFLISNYMLQPIVSNKALLPSVISSIQLPEIGLYMIITALITCFLINW